MRPTRRAGWTQSLWTVVLGLVVVAVLAFATAPEGEVAEVVAALDPSSTQSLLLQAVMCAFVGASLHDLGL